MKLISLSILLVLSCNRNNNNFDSFSKIPESSSCSKAIVISCIRCSCIIEDLNSLISKKDSLLNEYTFFGDTSCLETFLLKNEVIHIGQSSLDSISTDFYNILIYNKNKHGNKLKMIKTAESEKIKFYL